MTAHAYDFDYYNTWEDLVAGVTNQGMNIA